ncbi:MAG: laccase domain-containing protein, partial [Endozoicomonas sp.]
IGAAHAGWRGALGGVLEATVNAMTAYKGVTLENISVRLFHPVLKSDVLVDIPLENDDRFSCSTNGSHWVAAFEKVFYANSIGSLKLCDDSQDLAKKLHLTNNNLEQIKISYLNSDGKPQLDWCQLTHALMHLPIIESTFQKPSEDPVMMIVDKETISLIRENIRYGVPVILGSKPLGEISTKFAVMNGVAPRHAVAVIKEAFCQNAVGEKVEGVLLYDPHGDDAGNQNDLDGLIFKTEECQVDINGMPALFFVPWKELPDNFVNAAVARGGIALLKNK